ncbi:MAG: flagellar motor protein MotB, partial [Paracoccaceae bacterium]
KALARAAEQLVASGGESMVADQALRHIFSRVSDQGLIVELFDLPDATLFVGDTDEPTILTIQLIKMIADIFQSTGNPIAVNGHVRARPIVARSSSGWELSVRRAQKLRMMLVSSGLHEGRMERVAGWADRKPADLDPMSVRNNRVEIILLRSDRAATGK